MSEGALFNPGFFGSQDGRWIGQVADDSTWRDNMLPGKFESANTIPGYGRRYKVRIMGVHDQDQEVIPDDQLPWSNIELPVTAGSGLGGSYQTPQIRQGMFVTGYFLDNDQQHPVITGLWNNNAQTILDMTTGMTGGKSYTGFSAFSEVKTPYPGTSKPKVPDNDVKVSKSSKETSAPPPGSILNKFGIAGNPTPKQLAMIASATATGGASGLVGTALDTFVAGEVKKGTNNLKASENLASSSPNPAPTKESDAIHQLSVQDKKTAKEYRKKIVTMKPDDIVQSSIKSIQTITENLSNELEFIMDSLKSYSGAMSAIGNPMQDMQKLIADAACQMAKYMKIIFDKVMNYVLKTMNKAMTKVTSAMPSSTRYMMSDMKETITELMLCMYGKMTNSICGSLAGLLNDMFKPDEMEKQAREDALTPQDPDAPNTYVKVPVCTAEDIVGQVLALHKDEIDSANNTIINNVNTFLDDLQSELAGITGAMSDMMTKMGGINGNMTAALGFANIKLNVFGCELNPTAGMSDYYTLDRGGSSTPQQQLPSNKAVEERAQDPVRTTVKEETPFVEPTGDSKNVTFGTGANDNTEPLDMF